jgi:hypothetical protein
MSTLEKQMYRSTPRSTVLQALIIGTTKMQKALSDRDKIGEMGPGEVKDGGVRASEIATERL